VAAWRAYTKQNGGLASVIEWVKVQSENGTGNRFLSMITSWAADHPELLTPFEHASIRQIAAFFNARFFENGSGRDDLKLTQADRVRLAVAWVEGLKVPVAKAATDQLRQYAISGDIV
jgi:hypothetical protein